MTHSWFVAHIHNSRKHRVGRLPHRAHSAHQPRDRLALGRGAIQLSRTPPFVLQAFAAGRLQRHGSTRRRAWSRTSARRPAHSLIGTSAMPKRSRAAAYPPMSNGVVSALRRRRASPWGGSAAGVAALLIDQKLPRESMNLGRASCASLAVGRARPQTSAKHASCVGPAVRRQRSRSPPRSPMLEPDGAGRAKRPQVRPPARTRPSPTQWAWRQWQDAGCLGSWCGGGLHRAYFFGLSSGARSTGSARLP